MATYEIQVVQNRGGDIDDDDMVNVLHLDEPGAAHTFDRAVEFAEHTRDLWIAGLSSGIGPKSLLAHQHPNVTLETIRVYRAGEQGLPIVVLNLPAGTVGTGTGHPLPPQTAVTISFRNDATGGPGRVGSRWGRMYLGGLGTGLVAAGGRLDTPVGEAIAEQFQSWAEQLPGGTRHVVFSRKEGTAKPISRYVVDNVFDVIRSRRHRSATVRAVRTYPGVNV